MMKKAVSILLLLLAVILPCAVAQAREGGYETRTVFYEDDYAMSAANAGGRLYVLRESGLYALSVKGSEEKIAPAEDFMGKIWGLLSDGQALYGRGSSSLTLLTTHSQQDIDELCDTLCEIDEGIITAKY